MLSESEFTRESIATADRWRLGMPVVCLVAVVALLWGATASVGWAAKVRFCSDTASAQFDACRNEVRDDFFEGEAICINISDQEERDECFSEIRSARQEDKQLCRAQFQARRDLCAAIGEERYDPDFDPVNFDDDFRNLTHPNPYFPLGIGNVWEYAAEDETNTVEVLDKTKLIEGVTCIVLNDFVETDDGGSEDTNDWHAQRKDGTGDYCGEEAKDFEIFPGDNPQEPELVSNDGSFKAGRDGDKSGTLFLGSPTVGTTYRQELSFGNAEDAATELSTSYSFGSNLELDEFVPQDLAELLCSANDCVVTLDFTPIEPGVFERKYYASGIGLFLEVKVGTGDLNQLVGCNFDPRCANLPTP